MMRYVVAIVLAILIGSVSSGRRFAVKDGAIHEMKPFTNEKEWLTEYELSSDG